MTPTEPQPIDLAELRGRAVHAAAKGPPYVIAATGRDILALLDALTEAREALVKEQHFPLGRHKPDCNCNICQALSAMDEKIQV